MKFSKKHIEIRVKEKKYRVKITGIFLILSVILTIVCLLFLLFSFLKNNSGESKPQDTIEKQVEPVKEKVVDRNLQEETLLHETDIADQSYIDRTLFLGDSNTARFLKVSDKNGKTFTRKENTIGVVGMGIDAISTLACMDFSIGRMTMVESVKLLQPERIIITFGTNNLSGKNTDAAGFIERYEKQLLKLIEAYPTVDLIVNSIPPITKNTVYTNLSMEQINAYNDGILKMCKKNNWKFLNSIEILKDQKTGYAKNQYMVADGLHLSADGLKAMFEYIRSHAYITEDDRMKPLASIPSIIGVPDGLIRTDPLTDAEFEEDPAGETFGETPESTPSSTPEPTPTPTATIEPTVAPSVEPTVTPTALPETPVPTPDTPPTSDPGNEPQPPVEPPVNNTPEPPLEAEPTSGSANSSPSE